MQPLDGTVITQLNPSKFSAQKQHLNFLYLNARFNSEVNFNTVHVSTENKRPAPRSSVASCSHFTQDISTAV